MDNSFLHRRRLLLVDDAPGLLNMVAGILHDAGFETLLTATTVKEAIITAKEEKPDLIVLDVMLPDGDGFSLMQQLRTFTDVPIIFLTAKDEAADKLSGLGLGADDYIPKTAIPSSPAITIPSRRFAYSPPLCWACWDWMCCASFSPTIFPNAESFTILSPLYPRWKRWRMESPFPSRSAANYRKLQAASARHLPC